MGIPSVGSTMDPSNLPSGRNAESATGSTGATGSAQAKRPGAIRVGVVAINNKTDRSPSTDSVRAALIGSINSGNIEAVPIDSTSASAIEAEAKQKGCDYILYTDIAQLKKSGSKVGGLLGRASGVGVRRREVRGPARFQALSRRQPVSAINLFKHGERRGRRGSEPHGGGRPGG